MTTILVTVLCLFAQAAPIQPTPLPQTPSSAAAADDYLIGPKDVIAVMIYGEDLYSRPSLTVDGDGMIEYPLIGSVKVGGLTARQVEQELVRRLSPRYLRSPNITVKVMEFRSQRVWVHGAVQKPQQVEIQGGATLMSVLSVDKAGPLTADAGSYILIIHASAAQSSAGPANPDQKLRPEDQIRIPRQDFDRGRANTIRLRDGDTVFVPTAERFFVSGEVKQTGGFPLTSELTVLKALAMAGGITERGAKNRITIKRMENGKEVEIKVKESDIVQPNDTIVVPRRRM
jgi:polysaccharide export outer membrane protein